MDADGAIELTLRGTALQRDAEALGDLRRVAAQHMAPEHAVSLAIDHQLHHGALLPTGERVFHRPEARAIDVDGASCDIVISLGSPR